ncbi:MAG: DUF370 domain-containing protein [Firmicutes bacterium]|nr:DUF370 domain-containing protein [Candidatus Colimorpha enterica]
MKFISAGYGNMVSSDRVISVVGAETSPIKRLISDAKDAGRAIDVTCGKKTKAVIITDSDHVILSALPVEKLTARLNGTETDSDEDEA